MKIDQLVRDVPDLTITTERLILRPMREADLPTAIAHEHERGIMRWIRDPGPDDEIEARCRQALEPWDGAEGRFALLAIEPRPAAGCNTDEMLGIVCWRVTAADLGTMEFGYRLHTDWHRRGFAFEACTALLGYLFETVEVRRLIALCAADNEPSWRLMEKLGMRREGEFREYSFLAGEWRDELLYAVLRHEWTAR
ncbi:MAG: GNAT family N-acetyltransferase [bacterium]|nr:GNAT family N-acetyltransferase [bacterium]